MPPEAPIAAVVLAAGASRRFGEANKLLVPIDGRPLISRTVDVLREGGVEDIVVVTGWNRGAIEAALQGKHVRCIHNAAWERGMGASIAVGIATVGPEASASFVVPGDMAFLTPASVRLLIDVSRKGGAASIVVPTTLEGAQRNPVLWPRRHFDALRILGGDAGAKSLLENWATECRMVAIDGGELADIDTVAELVAARAHFER